MVLVSAVVTLVAAQMAILGALWKTPLGGPPGFVRHLSLALAATAVIASLWSLAPVAVLQPCDRPYSAKVQSVAPHS
jgi:hypothetical protein